MKISSCLSLLLLAGLALPLAANAAATTPPPPPPPPPPAKPELSILVVDTLHSMQMFNRLAYHFERVLGQQQWPVTVKVDRFAANNEPHDLELRVFYQGIRNDFGERRFRAWMILHDHGVKHDFGMVEYTYQPRPGELMDDTLDHIFAGAAAKTASLLAPFVAPSASTAKP